MPSNSTRTTLLSSLLPHGAWDSHLHIISPDTFPTSASAIYTPHPAPLSVARANAARLSIPNLVLVQPSTYGTDNSCLLHHLRLLNSEQPNSARGIVVIDPNRPNEEKTEGRVSDEELQSWHEAGVRGVRVNLKSVNSRPSRQELCDLLVQYVSRLQDAGLRGWVVQVFMDLSDVGGLIDIAGIVFGNGRKGEEGGMKLVLDHMGGPDRLRSRPDDIDGWKELKRLMTYPGVFVKVSAPYRILAESGGEQAKVEDLKGLVSELLAAREGHGCVFATDWPHTRFEGHDIEEWVRACLAWAGDERTVDRLFKGNAEVLWDVPGDELDGVTNGAIDR